MAQIDPRDIFCPDEMIELISGGRIWVEGPGKIKLICCGDLCKKYPCPTVKTFSEAGDK